MTTRVRRCISRLLPSSLCFAAGLAGDARTAHAATEPPRTAERNDPTPPSVPFGEARLQLQQVRGLDRENALKTPGAARLESPELSIVRPAGQPPPSSLPGNKNVMASPEPAKQWLLDGFNAELARDREKNGDRPRSGRRSQPVEPDGGEREPSLFGGLSRSERKLEEGGAQKGQMERDRYLSEPLAAPNPLAGFLKDWMSPGDFALLAPGDADRVSAPHRSIPEESRPGLAPPISLGSEAPGLRARKREMNETPANPFLQALESGLSPVRQPVPANVGPQSLVSTPPAAPLPRPETEKPERTDKVQDNSKEYDRKYFPQLNRF